ncbi:hypothetical protein MTP99_011055 [Tenebrio molitor]|nr:hypothetical protein MTP99_011055 [Tenebrio molitor]
MDLSKPGRPCALDCSHTHHVYLLWGKASLCKGSKEFLNCSHVKTKFKRDFWQLSNWTRTEMPNRRHMCAKIRKPPGKPPKLEFSAGGVRGNWVFARGDGKNQSNR